MISPSLIKKESPKKMTLKFTLTKIECTKKERLKKVDNIPVLLPERLSITALPLRRLMNRSLQSSVHFTVLTCHQVPESMTPSVFPLGNSSIKLQPVYLIFYYTIFISYSVRQKNARAK